MYICVLSFALSLGDHTGSRQRRISSVYPLSIILCFTPLRLSFNEPVARLAASKPQLADPHVPTPVPSCPILSAALTPPPIILGCSIVMYSVCDHSWLFRWWWRFEFSPHSPAAGALLYIQPQEWVAFVFKQIYLFPLPHFWIYFFSVLRPCLSLPVATFPDSLLSLLLCVCPVNLQICCFSHPSCLSSWYLATSELGLLLFIAMLSSASRQAFHMNRLPTRPEWSL